MVNLHRFNHADLSHSIFTQSISDIFVRYL